MISPPIIYKLHTAADKPGEGSRIPRKKKQNKAADKGRRGVLRGTAARISRLRSAENESSVTLATEPLPPRSPKIHLKITFNFLICPTCATLSRICIFLPISRKKNRLYATLQLPSPPLAHHLAGVSQRKMSLQDLSSFAWE